MTNGQIAFEEVAVSSGVVHTGPSFGAAWGDFDGDRFPDLWVTNHRDDIALYRNLGDGTFSDVADLVLPVMNPPIDSHGATWGDYDNDGDQDLMQTVGAQSGMGEGANALFRNDQSQFVDVAVALGVDYPSGRGRTPLWVDWDRDGYLDLLTANLKRVFGFAPSPLFSQRAGVFVDEAASTGFDGDFHSFFAFTTGVQGMDLPLLVTHAPTFPARAYLMDGSGGPLLDVTSSIGLGSQSAVGVQDVAVADFDNNLEPDVFMASRVDRSDITQVDDHSLRATLHLTTEEHGVEVETPGDLRVRVSPDFAVPASLIFIGLGGAQPPADNETGVHEFVLSATDPSHVGWLPHTPGWNFGLYAGRDTQSGVWRIYLSSSAFAQVDIDLLAVDGYSSVSAIGFEPNNGALPDTMLKRFAGSYTDTSQQDGLAQPRPCDSVAAADFDNDADVDLYLVCHGMTGNHPNILLENDGTGAFTPVSQAGGAEGSTAGRGETVVAADYDLDGYMDLFVTNGYSFGDFSQGPNELFRNLGGTNHWLQIDLEGVTSNRDAVGSRVVVLSGDNTQIRERAGGVHRYAQHHSRLHFGLGQDDRADVVMVIWPDGKRQFAADLPADQLVRIVEKSAPSPDGAPAFTPGQDRGVYLWRDPGNDIFQLRVSGDAEVAQYTVRLVSVAPVQILAQASIDADDDLTTWSGGFQLVSSVLGDVDGLAFKLAPNATTYLAVERDGIRDPRDLHVGPQRAPISPEGWVVDLGAIPENIPNPDPGALGLYLGRALLGNEVSFRWTGDVQEHLTNLAVISAESLSAVPFDLEGSDALVSNARSISINGQVASDIDGVDVAVDPDAPFAISYRQDHLFQYHRVNPDTRELGLANAYRIR